ncbi:hypothetical protein KL919_004466 [Ogataea angusta]|nr:hypothetical protein KL919_004466 [Ogataea angusta]
MELKYINTQSFVDSSFFVKLSQLKLDVLKLDQSSRLIYGYYNYKRLAPGQAPAINLNDISFASDQELESQLPARSAFIVSGEITNVNTLEEFKSQSKLEFLTRVGGKLIDSIKNKAALQDPRLLAQFAVFSFADLKKYKFYYWFAFPALHSEWQITSEGPLNEDVPDLQFSLVRDGKPVPLTQLHTIPTDSLLHVAFVDTSAVPDAYSYVLRNFLTMLAIWARNWPISVL